MTAEPKRFRIGILGICHESNTFIRESTTLEDYHRGIFLVGEKLRQEYGNAHHEISGFFQTLDEAGMEAVPLIFAHTMPWGRVADDALATLWRHVCDCLDQAGPLDGILAAPHGAAVSESCEDMDGWWLTELRQKIGPTVPLIATMDPHANLSPAMVAACDALIAYRENPHLDQRQRGIEAANLMIRVLRGEIRPVMATSFPPIAINIERQLTTAEPMLSAHRELESTRSHPRVLSASIALGFPYADIRDMGSAFVVVTDGDPALAREEAERLARWLIENKERFRGEMISPEDALTQAHVAPKPVGLLDMGDNTGGGAPGDSTILAQLVREKTKLRTLFYLPDPEGVRQAQAAGLGGRIRMKIGGKLPMTPAPPLEIEAIVVNFFDGKYVESQPRHGGKTGGDLGPTAVVRTTDGLTVMLYTRRAFVGSSIQPLLAAGLRPEHFDIIIIKGVHAPVAAYADICPTLIRVNTQGVTNADMEKLQFHRRRQPLFPFEDLSA